MNVRLRSDIVAAASGRVSSEAATVMRYLDLHERVTIEALEYAIDVARGDDELSALRKENEALRTRIEEIIGDALGLEYDT